MQTRRQSHEIWHQLMPRPDALKSHVDTSKPVLEGPVKMYDSYTQSIKERYLVLSGRIVLICKKKGKRCLSWKDATGLNSRKDIAVVSDSSYKVPNVEFRIYSPQRTLIFFAPTVYERDMWVREMQQSIS